MPRIGTFFYQVSVADGFADDCDELIMRCSKVEPLTFNAFCKIWKEMKFPTIYKGRSLSAEIAELSEELLQIAKRYLTMDTSNFEESVAGLFLVYAVYSQQPHVGLASLRLTPSDMPALNFIQTIARRERRLDVLYILGAVLVKASQYHADSRERGMDVALRKYLDGCTGIDRNGVRPRGVLLRQNEEMDIIREVTALSANYTAAKMDVAECPGLDTSYKSMDYIESGMSTEMSVSLKKLINGIQDDDHQASAAAASASTAAPNPQEIKRRAMKSAIASVRHLTSLDERKTKGKSGPKSESKGQAGRVKRAHLTKPVTSASPKKGTLRQPSPQPSTSRESPTKLLEEDSSFNSSIESPLKSPLGAGRIIKAHKTKGRRHAAKDCIFSDSSINSDLSMEVSPSVSNFSTPNLSPLKANKNIQIRTSNVSNTGNGTEESQNDLITLSSEVNISPGSNLKSNRSPKGSSKVKKSPQKSQCLDISNDLSFEDLASRNTSAVVNESCAENSRLSRSSTNKSSPSQTILRLGYLIEPPPDDGKEKNGPNKVSTGNVAKNITSKASPRSNTTPKSSPRGRKRSKISLKKKSPLVSPNTKTTRRYKKRRKISSSESSDDSDESIPLDGDSDLDVSDDKLTDDDENDEFTFEQVSPSKKGGKKTVSEKDNTDKNAKNDSRLDEVIQEAMNENPGQELDIEVDSLPVFIESDKDGSMIAINIPNEDKPKQVERTTDARVLRSRLRNSTEVSLSKIESPPKNLIRRNLNQEMAESKVSPSSKRCFTIAKISKIVEAPQDKGKSPARSTKAAQSDESTGKTSPCGKNVVRVTRSVSNIRRTSRNVSDIEKSPENSRKARQSAKSDINIEIASHSDSIVGKPLENNSDIIKSVHIKRPDRREQKKTLVKSKFSRMGILPIGNFKDKG